MGDATLDGAARRNQRLRRDEASENARAAIVRAEPAEQIEVEGLEIEPIEETIELGHAAAIARRVEGTVPE